MKFVDMFCGMGTIRMGFEQAGHAAAEWIQVAAMCYKAQQTEDAP